MQSEKEQVALSSIFASAGSTIAKAIVGFGTGSQLGPAQPGAGETIEDETRSSLQPTEPGMQHSATALTFALGAMWSVFVTSFVIFISVQPGKPADLAFYFSTFVAVPVAGYFALRLAARLPNRTRVTLSIEILILTLIAASTFTTSPVWLISLVGAFLIIVGVVAFAPRNRFVDHGSQLLILNRIWIIAAIASAACVVGLASIGTRPYLYWPYGDPSSTPLTGPTGGPDYMRILSGAVAAFLVFAAVRLVAATHRGTKYIVGDRLHYLSWILMGVLITYLLVRPVPSFNPWHYSPYLGPLHLLHHGGWPLIDVFSQYGLSFLAYLPLGFLLPYNHAGAAFVTYAFNIAMLLVSLGMIYKLVGERRFALPIASTLLIVVWFSFPYNLDLTPSVFGVRWLPTWILALLLLPRTAARPGVGSLLWPVLLLNICALWSLESHLVAIVIFAVHRALALRLTGARPWRAVLGALMAVPLSLFGHAFFIVATLVARQEMPSYGIYLEFLQSYASSENVVWLDLARNAVITNVWLLFACVYAAIIFLALTSFVLGRSLFVSPYMLIGLSVLATAGVAQGSYFIGRPDQATLAVIALPFYTILISLLILFVDHVGRSKGLRYELALWCGMALVAWAVGYGWDRMRTDYDPPTRPMNHASLLVRCIDFGHCNPIRELRNVASGIREDASLIDSVETKRRVDELAKAFRKWRDLGPAVALIGEERTRALIDMDVQDAIRASNLANDVLSPTLAKRHLNSLAEMPAGSFVIANRYTSQYELQLLCGLLRKYRLDRVETTRGFFVDRVVPLDHDLEIGTVPPVQCSASTR